MKYGRPGEETPGAFVLGDCVRRRDFVLGAPALVAPSLMLGAAAPAPAPTPRWPEPDEALVYFFYPRLKGGDGRSFWVRLDGQRVVKLEVNQYSFIYLTPGQHIATAPPGLEYLQPRGRDEQFSVTVDGAQVYYFRLSTVVGPLGVFESKSQPPVIQEVPKELARPEMLRCVYRAPEPEWPLTR